MDKKELENILKMLEYKKRFLSTLEDNLKAINDIIPLVASCAKDYELQIEQINGMLKEPTVTVEEKKEDKPSESTKA